MSLEDFVHQLETTPSGWQGGSGNARDRLMDEMLSWKRKVKVPKKGEEPTEKEVIDVDIKTRLSNPTAVAMVETLANYIEQEFGSFLKFMTGESARDYLDFFVERFKIDMIPLEGKAREEAERILIGMNNEESEERKSLLQRLSNI